MSRGFVDRVAVVAGWCAVAAAFAAVLPVSAVVAYYAVALAVGA